VGLKIQKGSLVLTVKKLTSTTYMVQNNSDENREFVIDYPIRPEWTLVADEGQLRKVGPDVFRFQLTVPQAKAAAKELKEERIVQEKGRALIGLGEVGLESNLHEYLDHPVPSAAVKAALAKALGLAAKLQETTKQVSSVDRQLEDMAKDQGRLRSNLHIVPQTSEHYQKFLEKFVAQETTIENLQRQ